MSPARCNRFGGVALRWTPLGRPVYQRYKASSPEHRACGSAPEASATFLLVPAVDGASDSQRQPHVRRARQGLGTHKRAIVYERLGLTVVDDVSGLLAVEMKGRVTRSSIAWRVVGLHEGRSILEHHGDSITRPNAIGLEESGKLISPGVEPAQVYSNCVVIADASGCRSACQASVMPCSAADSRSLVRVETGHCSLHRFLSQRYMSTARGLGNRDDASTQQGADVASVLIMRRCQETIAFPPEREAVEIAHGADRRVEGQQLGAH